MTRTRIVGLASLLMLATTASCSQVRKTEPVGLERLQGDPSRYDRRVVQVQGYVWFGRENDALCTSLDDVSSCIDLERSGLLNRHRGSYFRDFHHRRATFAAQFVVMPPPKPDPPCVAAGECIMVGMHTPYVLRLMSAMQSVE
jgi:hypothetical protein